MNCKKDNKELKKALRFLDNYSNTNKKISDFSCISGCRIGRMKADQNFREVDYSKFAAMYGTSEIPTVPVTKISNGGAVYFADCPYCGTTKILSTELNSGRVLCEKPGCFKIFNIVMSEENENGTSKRDGNR